MDVPIGAVTRRFGLRPSTLHYWERRGLLTPRRRAGWRYYGEEEVFRIALIATCRAVGLRVGEIAAVLDEAGAEPDWRTVVKARMVEMEEQIAALTSARAYLDTLISCPLDAELHTCPDFRDNVASRWPAA
ncbi:MerR family transcriptional regulator [Nocardia panacis]|uniref:MerR family transcriptional regulator n=1 Tax=Nocardia panacis TaxID=2340916 RepID=A0A3A4KGR9_9NOCA|nr:MerR family transcriptional regulator [Nocardia panacis]RJO73669.1 MerR family transcriptional regulator [Nocardia panacis]